MDVNTFIKSGILEQYVLGLTSEEETQEVEQYAVKHMQVRKKIRKLKSCMEHYSKLHEIPPPKRADKQILKEINYLEKCGGLTLEYKRGANIPCPVSSKDFSWLRKGAAAMLIASLATLSLWFYQKQNKANLTLTKMSEELKATKAAFNSLSFQNKKLLRQTTFLKDMQTQRIPLQGAELQPQSLAVLFCNPDHRESYLNIVNLPKPPTGHQYQLWADINGEHRNLGMLEAASDSADQLMNFPFMENCKGFAITLEEEGGSQRPTTTNVCLKGQMRHRY